MTKILYPGTFNPFTKGHSDILERILKIAEKVVIGIGVNIDKPEAENSANLRAETIREYLRNKGLHERVDVMVYSGLTAEKAIEIGATCMARGVRSCADFEYEYSLAAANRDAFGVETILIPASPELSFVSSSLIREIQKAGEWSLAEKYIAK